MNPAQDLEALDRVAELARTAMLGIEPGHPRTTDDAGVWIYANEYPFEGITLAIPYATETEALRAANDGDVGRAVFVPYGTDLKDVLG